MIFAQCHHIYYRSVQIANLCGHSPQEDSWYKQTHRLLVLCLDRYLLQSYTQKQNVITLEINTYTARPVCWREWIS